METGKVLSFGEVLLRLSPAAGGEWISRRELPVFVGGAEANVATALAGWGVSTRYVSALPEHYLGDDVVAYLHDRGIDTAFMHRSGHRIGSYYLRQGADLKGDGVIYDRHHSSFYDLKPGMIDWEAALAGVRWFNFSAITPALNANLAAVCREALEAARARGITCSVDLNYRARLWQYGQRPDAVMPALVAHCEVVMGNIWAANTLLGIPLDGEVAVQDDKAAYLAHARETSQALLERFPHCRAVANTFRFGKGPAGLEYYTTLYTQGDQYVSPHFITDKVIDKVGSGDCFMAGLIYGLYHGHRPQKVIDFATAAAFGKLMETGDATGQTTAAVFALLEQHARQQKG